jgi:hypothetical protein
VGRRRIYENDTARVRAYRQRIAAEACAAREARVKESNAVIHAEREAERLKLRVAVLEADNAGLWAMLQAANAEFARGRRRSRST